MDIQLPQILFQMVNFSVVVGALTYLLYKPVQKIFEERADRIAAGQKAAEESIAQQSKLDEQARKIKKEAEREAVEILEEAKQKAEARKKQIIAEAKELTDTQRAKLMEEWTAEKQQMLKQMRQELVDAVIATSQKVIGNSFDTKAQTKLIDQEIDALVKTI
jgi:F-type H+-transporting ATPase subunit b